MMYFELSVHLLIDLIQESFGSLGPDSAKPNESSSNAHNVSVVLFFCTLRELLLNSLIAHLCWAQRIPRAVHERLLADSNSHALRQNNLLPALTGKKWKALVAEEARSSQLDDVEIDEFTRKAVEARNKFMHQGNGWGIDRALASGCIHRIWPLLNFYVALHNRYVHPAYLAKSNP